MPGRRESCWRRLGKQPAELPPAPCYYSDDGAGAQAFVWLSSD